MLSIIIHFIYIFFQITKKDLNDDLKHITHDGIYSTKTQNMHNYQKNKKNKKNTALFT